MSQTLRNCRNCHCWVPIEHIGDTGECRRFPPSVVPDYTLKRVEMMAGKPKILIDQITSNRSGVFPMTGGSTWCGEWTKPRHQEQTSLRQDEQTRIQKIEEFANRHPGEL